MSPLKAEKPEKTAVWDIETSHPDIAEKVEISLKNVMDPEIGMNIIELGLVRNITIDPESDKANVLMIMTTPFCPYAPVLLEAARSGTEEALGIETTIEMGMEMWDLSYMAEGMGGDWGLF
jgi:metal-sulfur cluster biosynthetic enzyme